MIAQRLTGVKYLDTSRHERLAGLTDILVDAYDRKGQGASGAAELAARLDSEIGSYMGRQLTFAEAAMAIDWGLHGEFGEYTGLNAERLFRFVRAYLESDDRKNAVKLENERRAGGQGSTLSRDEINRRNWEAMLQEFRELCETWRKEHIVVATLPRVRMMSADMRRELTGMCYEWLKAVGLVTRDESTLGCEIERMKEAEKMIAKEDRRTGGLLDQTVPSIPSAVKSLGNSLMMQTYFLNADAAGLDLDSVIAGLDCTPQQDRRFWL